MIRLEGISKVYGMGETLIHALAGVGLSIEPGEYCAIMGASGSGKSTMMNLIGCLDRPTTAAYYLDDENVAELANQRGNESTHSPFLISSKNPAVC